MMHKLHSDYAKACVELSDIETTLGASLQAAAGNMDALVTTCHHSFQSLCV